MAENLINNPEPTLLDGPASSGLGGPASPNLGGPASSGLGGPKFSHSKKFGEKSKVSNWLKKHGANVVVPIIAVCILLGGIYLYKNWPTGNENQLTNISQPEPTEPSSDLPSLVSPEDAAPELIIQESSESMLDKTVLSNQETITARAEKGEGITHLARKALKEYTQDNVELSNKLTKEQKVYIEDYLKDKKLAEREGNDLVNVDESISFDQDLLKKAVEKALELNTEQLKNLEKYSILVPSL